MVQDGHYTFLTLTSSTSCNLMILYNHGLVTRIPEIINLVTTKSVLIAEGAATLLQVIDVLNSLRTSLQN